MLSEAIRLCEEGENLLLQQKRAEALACFEQALTVLNRISTCMGSVQAYAVLSVQARAAREATFVMIAQKAPLVVIYGMIATERTALETQLSAPIFHESLHQHLSTFSVAVDSDNDATVKRVTEILLRDLFGIAGPTATQKAQIALIRNYLIHARLIFDREKDAMDAMALAQHALSEALALTANFPTGAAEHPVIPLISEILDLFAHLRGDTPSWHARAQTVRRLLPIAPDSWSMALISQAGIAALFAGLSMPGDPDWFHSESESIPSDLF